MHFVASLHRAAAPATALSTLRASALLLLAAALPSLAHAQGCVAIKQMGDDSVLHSAFDHPAQDKWNLSVSYLHFRSHRHFVGTEEQHQRYTAGSEVINVVEQFDVALSYSLNPRTSLTLGVPYFSASRTSLYEHDRVHRFQMNSQGIGDTRLTAARWLVDPATDPKGNVELGFGFKFPTGNTNVKDYAHTTSGLVLRNVDQSIQPGDGGFGYVFTAQAYRQLPDNLSLYATAFYLLNPQETNGTRNGNNPASVTGYMSIADQYQARLGLSRLISKPHALAVSFGGRIEGVPAHDIVGGDRGFRRPGYVISLEPGISFSHGRDSFALSVPWAIVRNRVRSYADQLSGGHGDAAFADFLISLTYSRHW